MADFYQLKRELLVSTLVLTALIFASVWFFYSLTPCPKLFTWGMHRCGLLENVGEKCRAIRETKDEAGKFSTSDFVRLMIVAPMEPATGCAHLPWFSHL